MNSPLFAEVYDAIVRIAAKHPNHNMLDLAEVLVYLAIYLTRRYSKPGQGDKAVDELDFMWQNFLLTTAKVQSVAGK